MCQLAQCGCLCVPRIGVLWRAAAGTRVRDATSVRVSRVCAAPKLAAVRPSLTCVYVLCALLCAVNARNVLVSSCPDVLHGVVAKLADLGLSRVIRLHSTHKTTNTVGTLRYACWGQAAAGWAGLVCAGGNSLCACISMLFPTMTMMTCMAAVLVVL